MLRPTLFRDIHLTFKTDGLRGIWKKFGWKFFAAFFCYYLIRDLMIYIFVPWYVAQKFF